MEIDTLPKPVAEALAALPENLQPPVRTALERLPGEPGLPAQSAGAAEAVRARMFSTAGGVREDPATGSATAAPAGMLAAGTPSPGRWRWRIDQGVERGRPSRIFAEAENDGHTLAIRISEEAVIVGTGRLGTGSRPG